MVCLIQRRRDKRIAQERRRSPREGERKLVCRRACSVQCAMWDTDMGVGVDWAVCVCVCEREREKKYGCQYIWCVVWFLCGCICMLCAQMKTGKRGNDGENFLCCAFL